MLHISFKLHIWILNQTAYSVEIFHHIQIVWICNKINQDINISIVNNPDNTVRIAKYKSICKKYCKIQNYLREEL